MEEQLLNKQLKELEDELKELEDELEEEDLKELEDLLEDNETIQMNEKPNKSKTGCALSILWKFVSFFLSYTVIWSIISEILLLIHVYSINDIKFFILSCIFLCVPLLVVSSFICFMRYDEPLSNELESDFIDLADSGDLDDFELELIGHNRSSKISVSNWIDGNCNYKYLFYIPILNIPFILSHSKISDSISSKFHIQTLTVLQSLLTGTMAFPLYIINLSYLCESVTAYNNISIYNLLQLLFSIINFIKTPSSLILSTITLVDDKHISISGKIRIFLSTTLGFMPVVLIEIIHFFPFIFAYYIDKALTFNQLIVVMIIFNVPKLIFIIHINAKICKSEIKEYGVIFLSVSCIISTFIFVTVPLVPYLLIILTKQPQQAQEWIYLFTDNGCCGSSAKYYWNVVIYLFISYGGSCIYIVIFCGYNQLSLPVQISILVIITMVILITLTFPFSLTWMRKNGAFFYFSFKDITTIDDSELEDEYKDLDDELEAMLEDD